jgi:hypothetical protein
VKRLIADLFDRDPEYVRAIVSVLVEITQCVCNIDFVVAAVQFVNTWDLGTQNHLSIVLAAVETRFFVTGLMPILSRQVHSADFFKTMDTPPSAERQILCEIAYRHEDLIPVVFEMAADAIMHCPRACSIDDALLDLYEICFYLFRLGQHLEFLQLIATPTPSNDQYLKRKFLVILMGIVRPPFSKEFLRQLLDCLCQPPIKSLFFPERGKPVPAFMVTALETLARFAEQLNRNEETRSFQEDVGRFDELRRDARRTLEVAKGVAQHSIRAFL